MNIIQINVLKNILTYSLSSRICTRKNIRYMYNPTQPMSQHQVDQREKEAFHGVFTDVVESVATHPAIAAVPDLEGWLKKCYDYNLKGGKAARGLSVVTAYGILEKPKNITEESMRLAHILGWCVEMVQAYFLVLDDIMDASLTRRGRPCWYRQHGVTTACAINDAILINSGMMFLIKKHFRDRPNYSDMLDTINEITLCSTAGQFLDLKTTKMHNEDYIRSFTPETHLTIVKFKTAYYTYDLPIYLGYLLTGNKLDKKERKQVQDLSLVLGTLFQIQDDYIDCYGEESLTGKVGTDIQEGKCSWLAVSALQRCNEAQRVVFKACYGSKEPAHIERIKRLYDQLQLPKLYKKVEGKYYDDILEKIKVLPTEEWKILFNKLLGITYKRIM